MLEVLSDVGHRTLKKQVLNGFGPDVKSALYLAAEHGRADVVNGLLTVSDHSIIFEPTGDTVNIIQAILKNNQFLGFTCCNCF